MPLARMGAVRRRHGVALDRPVGAGPARECRSGSCAASPAPPAPRRTGPSGSGRPAGRWPRAITASASGRPRSGTRRRRPARAPAQRLVGVGAHVAVGVRRAASKQRFRVVRSTTGAAATRGARPTPASIATMADDAAAVLRAVDRRAGGRGRPVDGRDDRPGAGPAPSGPRARPRPRRHAPAGADPPPGARRRHRPPAAPARAGRAGRRVRRHDVGRRCADPGSPPPTRR